MRIGLGRMDNIKSVEVNDGVSILSALRMNGFTPSENEVVQNLRSDEFDGSEEVENGETYVLVDRMKNGEIQQ